LFVARERKASMAEMIPIDVMFSESVIADMKAEVDDLDSSSSDENEKKLIDLREEELPSFNLLVEDFCCFLSSVSSSCAGIRLILAALLVMILVWMSMMR